jgi:FSR family fosmidomycin resistance protein-like MFS transporter
MPNSKKFKTLDVATIASAHFVHDIFSSFLAPILPLLIDKLGFSLGLAGVLSMIQRIPSLLNPFVGLAADKLPMRYLLIAAPTITATSMSLLGAAPSYTLLVILLLMMGVGASMFHVPAPVIIRSLSGNRVGKGMSFFMFGGEIARSIGPIVILGAVSLWGLEGTWKLIPVGVLASVILFFRLRKFHLTETFANKKKEEKVSATLKNLYPLFASIAFATFFIAMLKGALTAFLPTFITMKGETVWAGGIALSVLQLSGAAGSFLSGTISDKLGRRNTLLVIVLLAPIFLWGFILTDGILSFILLILLGLVTFSTTPILLAIVNNIKTERPAFINGVYITINFFIGGGAILLVGVLGDILTLEITYKIVGTSILLSVPFIFKIEKQISS